MGDDPRPEWAVRLQAERERRFWGKSEMARRLSAASGMPRPEARRVRSLTRQIAGWEKGEHFPIDWAGAYAAAYGLTEEELFGDTGLMAAAGPLPAGTLTTDPPTYLAEVIAAMERRQALVLMGLGVAAPWPVAENLRTALSRVAGSSDSVADWRETVEDHARAMPVTPAAQMLPELLSDLTEVDALLQAGHPRQEDMLEIAAALAMFTSMETYESGHPGQAFRWWRTAQQLADRSGRRPIRAYVRARRGADLLYGRGQTGRALALADEAVSIAHEAPSVGLAEAYALRAGALAHGGDPAARGALDDLANTADRLRGGEMFVPGLWASAVRVQAARTATYVKLGDGKAAIQAGQAITSPHPQTQMWMAAATILAGRVDDGLGHAVQILSNLDPANDKLSVRDKGRDVLAVVPDRARTSAAARELRALTAGRSVL